MQVFARELVETHCPGVEWPDFLGTVHLGEPFVVETERCNRANGPIAVEGVRAGEAIAVHIEAIDMVPPFESPNGGPFFEGMGDPVPLEYRDGLFHYPNGLVLRARPSVGNVAVLPAPTEAILALSRRDLGPPGPQRRGWGWRGLVNDPRGKHCHQDCAYLTAGSTIHLKVQVDRAGLCLADVHGYTGQGELAFAGIEVAARIRLRVERSAGWYVDWPLIETADEIMVFCSDINQLSGTTEEAYVDIVRRAYAEMRKVVAHRLGGPADRQTGGPADRQTGGPADRQTGGSIADANPIVAAALDIRNCALYGLGNYVQKDGKVPGQPDGELAQPDRDIAVVGVLPKEIFA